LIDISFRMTYLLSKMGRIFREYIILPSTKRLRPSQIIQKKKRINNVECQKYNHPKKITFKTPSVRASPVILYIFAN